MPFQVFRRHQRKMMAALAIFAMVAFSLDFSLFRNQFSAARENSVVVTLYGEKYRQSDVDAMKLQRYRVNQFVSLVLNPRGGYAPYFGDTDTRSIVDSLIMQHEAERLGIPADKDLAIRWLRQRSQPPLTSDRFETIYREHFANQVTDVQLLEEVANQVRIQQVLMLPGTPIITPLDLYDAYRDQRQTVSALVVSFPVEEYLAQVAEPSDAEARAYFDKYKNQLPDPSSPTPGFMIPRKIQVEYVRAEPNELAKTYQERLTNEELRQVYQARSSEFPLPPPELPTNLFADDPDATLTPPHSDPFEQVRDLVARTVAREKAQEEIDTQFGQLIDEAIKPFSDRYGDALAANDEARAENKPAQPLPKPGDLLQQAARKLGLFFERTPLMDRDLASRYGQIGSARRGGSVLDAGTPFADLFFDPRAPLYEEVQLTDDLGRRFLAWKIDDVPARVPAFDEVRSQVIHAWKVEKARALAENAAKAFAKEVEASGHDIRKAAGTARTVIETSPVPKLQPGMLLNMFGQSTPPRPSEILQIPDAGETLREALFNLEPGQVKVAPNQPETTYYVLTLNQRSSLDLAGLFDTYGERMTIQQDVQSEAFLERIRAWREELRTRAGLDPNWVAPEELRAAQETAPTP